MSSILDGMAGGVAGAEGLARLAAAAVRTRAATLAGERALPVAAALTALCPDGLRRGSTVAVAGGAGSTSLALVLLAGPSAAGSWVAVAGVPTLGLAAAAGFGVVLGRLVVVSQPPPPSCATVLSTLVDAFDIVLARPPQRVRAADARRLVARARERGSVLLVASGDDRWPEPVDLRLTAVATTWEGLGDGHGHLRARRVTVQVSGRRAAARTRRVELWLPAPGGGVAPVESTGTTDATTADRTTADWTTADAATADRFGPRLPHRRAM